MWTDFRIGPDGYTRMLVHDHGLSPLRLGRVVRRIHEIETYRMMALLALPLARKVQAELAGLERAVSKVTADMLSARESHEDEELLGELSRIARDVEEVSSRTSYRFAASRAYAALVDKRIAELGEEKVMSFQRIGVFLDRRFSPPWPPARRSPTASRAWRNAANAPRTCCAPGSTSRSRRRTRSC